MNILKQSLNLRIKLSTTIKNSIYPIHYYNFWTDQLAKDIWFSRFINYHHLLPKGHRLNFYSVLGPVENLSKLHAGSNVFFSGENLHTDRFSDFRKKCMEDTFDLYLDFDTSLNEHSFRFPLWILYMFEPESEMKDITERVKELRFPRVGKRSDFCSIVASHDWNGIRSKIMDQFSEIEHVDSGGSFRHNTDKLRNQFQNDKHQFIQQYKFNICPENSNSEGYVTEKIFQSILAGCIPVYWGSNNNPEPEIINKDAVFFYDESNQDILNNKIKNLWFNEKTYWEVASQPRLLDKAEEVIYDYFQQLKKQFNALL